METFTSRRGRRRPIRLDDDICVTFDVETFTLVRSLAKQAGWYEEPAVLRLSHQRAFIQEGRQLSIGN